MRSSRVVVLGVVAFGLLLGLPGSGFVACAPDQKVCTADNSGHGGERALVRRDLPGLDAKSTCNPHIVAVTNADDLRRAYEDAGIPIADPDAGTPPAGATALPAVDFTKESVIIREATDAQGIAWMTVSGTTATVGTQGCKAQGTGACKLQVIAVDAVLTEADGYSCEDINCGGTSINPGAPTSH
jgi:hypothetical protein